MVSTWNKGWKQPRVRDAQGRKAEKDTAPCPAASRQAGGKPCVLGRQNKSAQAWHGNHQDLFVYWLELFSSMDAQGTCLNSASKRSWRTTLGYLHGFHAASWPGLRGCGQTVLEHTRSHHTPSVCRGMFPTALPKTCHGLQPEEQLVVSSLKPNQPPQHWMVANTRSSPWSHLLGRRAPAQTQERYGITGHAEPSSSSLVIPRP